MLAHNAVLAIVLFVALVLAASLQGLAASGHFPRSRRGPAAALEPVVLFGSIAVVIVCLAAGIAAALRLIPWYAAVIGGGLSILAAPPVLQRFSDRFVDGSRALATFAAACAVFALLLIWMAMATTGTGPASPG